MYPKIEAELNPELPATAEFWTPESDDIDEEGFGYFRDVWPVIDVPETDAREMIDRDRTVSSFVAGLASNADEFDAIAKVIETGEAHYGENLSADKRAALDPYIAEDEDEEVLLDGLEVGVAGLVYALSSAGAYPAASCRGHPQSYAWSDAPVVFVAIDRLRASVLAPLVRDSACGFEIDGARPELLVVCSTSIEGTVSLAEAVAGKWPEFRACGDGSYLPPDYGVQPSLFDEEI